MDMDSSKPRQLQVLIRSPDLQLRNRAVTLTLDDQLNQTWGDLKRSLVPSCVPVPERLLSSLFFSINGKTLRDEDSLSTCRIPSLSTLTLQLKLLGGGGDGGATGAESRDCYLNMYAEKKPDKVDPNEQRLSKWTTCALSFEPLKPPCVIDRLGNVFNKETLVKSLLAKTLPKHFRHIKGLKDMIPIHLSPIPGFESDDHFQGVAVGTATRFQCPITGLEFNGKYKFFALTNCGHVLSAKALKEIKSSACHVCHKDFQEADKIVINGSDEEVAALRERMEEDKAAKLKEKKPKKIKAGEVTVNGDDHSSSRLSGKKHGFDVNAVAKPDAKLQVNAKLTNGAAAPGASAKAPSDAPAKRFKAVDFAPPNADKKVYASIFTSSRKSEFKETYSCRSLPLGRN